MIREADRWLITGPAAGIIVKPDMDKAAHEGAGGNNDRFREISDSGAEFDAAQLASIQIQRRDLPLLEVKTSAVVRERFSFEDDKAAYRPARAML